VRQHDPPCEGPTILLTYKVYFLKRKPVPIGAGFFYYYGKPTARFLAYLKEQENGNKMDHNI
jgi:hypothetical protein